ncbi:hypothetical protein KCU99_g383, partial [Aureobasidium melanogenum]
MTTHWSGTNNTFPLPSISTSTPMPSPISTYPCFFCDNAFYNIRELAKLLTTLFVIFVIAFLVIPLTRKPPLLLPHTCSMGLKQLLPIPLHMPAPCSSPLLPVPSSGHHCNLQTPLPLLMVTTLLFTPMLLGSRSSPTLLKTLFTLPLLLRTLLGPLLDFLLVKELLKLLLLLENLLFLFWAKEKEVLMILVSAPLFLVLSEGVTQFGVRGILEIYY